MMDPSHPWAMWKSLSISHNLRVTDRGLPEILEWVCTGDIGIQDKEWGIILAQNLLCKCKRSSCIVSPDHSSRVTVELSSPVPRGSVSTLKVMLIPSSSSVFFKTETMTSGR